MDRYAHRPCCATGRCHRSLSTPRWSLSAGLFDNHHREDRSVSRHTGHRQTPPVRQSCSTHCQVACASEDSHSYSGEHPPTHAVPRSRGCWWGGSGLVLMACERDGSRQVRRLTKRQELRRYTGELPAQIGPDETTGLFENSPSRFPFL